MSSNPILRRTGLTLTQAGLELLAELSDNNTSLNWTDVTDISILCLSICARLATLGEGRDYTVKEQATRPPQLQAREPREPQSYEELRTAAEAEYLAMAQPVWNDFQTYLMENWGVSLTTSQKARSELKPQNGST